MSVYNIAGLKVFMEPKYDTTLRQSEKYLAPECSKEDADIIIDYPVMQIEWWRERAPHFNEDSCEYMSLGACFYHDLLDYDGIMLHSSAVVYENRAYLFSAKSGTGKSTHTSLWLKHFGEDKAYILNDDKPAIRRIDGRYFACGTPFSGKVDLSRNELVPLQAICVIKRDSKNSIRRLEPGEALYPIMNQTIRPAVAGRMNRVLDILDDLTGQIPVYELKCNISEEAVEIAYERMRNI